MSSHIGRDGYLEVSGQRYRLSRYTRELEAEFIKWAHSLLPDPIAQARQDIAGFPEFIQLEIVNKAVDAKRKRDAGISEEVEAIRNSQKGIWKILCLLFQKYNPELSERDIGHIFDECLEQHGAHYLPEKLSEAQGVVKSSDLPQEASGEKKE